MHSTQSYVRLETLSRRSILKLAGSLVFVISLVTLVGAFVGPEFVTQMERSLNKTDCVGNNSKPLFFPRHTSVFETEWTLGMELLPPQHRRHHDAAPDELPNVKVKYALLKRVSLCGPSGYATQELAKAQYRQIKSSEWECAQTGEASRCFTPNIFGMKMRAQHGGNTTLPFCIVVQTTCIAGDSGGALRMLWGVEESLI